MTSPLDFPARAARSAAVLSTALCTTLSAALLIALSSTEAFSLGGTVRNAAGRPLARAVVTLVSDPTIRHVTDSTGAFTLTPTGLAFHFGAGGMNRVPGDLSLRGNLLGFNLRAPAAHASFTLFSADGGTLFATPTAALNAGAHTFTLPPLAPGLYVLRVLLDGHATTTRLAVTGPSGGVLSARRDPLVPGPARAASSRAVTSPRSAQLAADAVDTLLVKRVGYLTSKVPVPSYGAADLAVILPADTVSPLAPVADYGANGPFATVVETNVGPGGNYTIVRPETLGANGLRHGPLIYGHGINGQVSGFTTFLRSVASHGFVIIARNVLTGGPNNAGNTAAMNDGLNWILAQDTATGSIYRGKLATDRAAAMGYSVGGTAAVDIGGHPSLRTVVSIHGHISNAALNGTLLQTSGTLDNVGLPMQQQTFDSSDVQTFLGTVTGANHGYIQNNNGGVQRAAIIAWLRFWIYNDQGARPYFYGNACVMCAAPWENPQRKNWD